MTNETLFDQVNSIKDIFSGATQALNDASLRAFQLKELLDALDEGFGAGGSNTEKGLRRVEGLIGAALNLANEMYATSDQNCDELDRQQRLFRNSDSAEVDEHRILTPHEHELVMNYRNASPDRRKIILDMAKQLYLSNPKPA